MSINLLPWRENLTAYAFQKSIYRLMLYAVLIFACNISVKYYLEHRNAVTQLNIVKTQQKIKNIIVDPDAKNNKKLLFTLQSLYPQKNSTIQKNKALENNLLRIADVIPSSITLLSLNIDAKNIIVNGISQALPAIQQYYHVLQKTIGDRAVLSDVHNDAAHNTEWLFTIRITT